MANGSGIKVVDIMTGEVVIAKPEMTIVEAAKLMNAFRIGGLPVVESGKLVGMLTERDIMRRVIAVNKTPNEVFVKDVMTSNPVKSNIDEDMNTLAMKMAKFDVTRVPIVDGENKLVGIITNRDVLKNSSEYLDVLMEQAKIKGQLSEDYTAFGKCELCGDSTHLVFKSDRFVCDACAQMKKKKLK